MDKEVYTLNLLLKDIQDAMIGDNDGEVDERAQCEDQDKLIVMQMLIKLAAAYSGKKYENEEKLKNAIDVVLKGNEQLSGYMFFMSQNPQFSYTWSYMRKRMNRYGEYLVEAIHFLNEIVKDINLLTGAPRIGNEMHVVFDDLIDVALMEGSPSVRSSVLWKNYYRVSSVKRVYNVIVKIKDNVLVAGIRKGSADTGKLMDMALKMIGESNKEAK